LLTFDLCISSFVICFSIRLFIVLALIVWIVRVIDFICSCSVGGCFWFLASSKHVCDFVSPFTIFTILPLIFIFGRCLWLRLLLSLLLLCFGFVLDRNQSGSVSQIRFVVGEDVVDFTVKICVNYFFSPLHLFYEEFICNFDYLVANFLEPSENILDELSGNQSQVLKNLFEAFISGLPQLIEWL
jgi:hypothetical protein